MYRFCTVFGKLVYSRKAFDAIRERAGVLSSWDNSALRHSAASHHYKFHENPRMIVFQEEGRYDLAESGEPVDPHGNALAVVADWDDDGEIVLGGRKLTRKVAAWTVGGNRKSEEGQGDDITPGW